MSAKLHRKWCRIHAPGYFPATEETLHFGSPGHVESDSMMLSQTCSLSRLAFSTGSRVQKNAAAFGFFQLRTADERVDAESFSDRISLPLGGGSQRVSTHHVQSPTAALLSVMFPLGLGLTSPMKWTATWLSKPPLPQQVSLITDFTSRPILIMSMDTSRVPSPRLKTKIFLVAPTFLTHKPPQQ